MKELEGKVVFITGGTSGIGLACTEAYVRAGAQVAFMGLEPDLVEQTAQRIGTPHFGICGDITQPEVVSGAITQIIAQFGRLDAVHNNAGLASPAKPLHLTSEIEFNRLFEVNVKSIYWTSTYAYPFLQQSKGVILNTSSLVGQIGQDNHAVYAASKGAVNALTKSMAIDYAKDGIRVNAVLPAAVMTPMLRQWAEEQEDPSQTLGILDDLHILGHCPEGDVIADACIFLLSDKARFITGLNMPVSGGAELGYRRSP